MTFVLPTNETVTNFGELMVWANNTVDGVMGWGLITIVFAIVFFGAQRNGARTSHAFLAALTTSAFITGGLTLLGVVSPSTLIIMLMLLTGAYIYTYHD